MNLTVMNLDPANALKLQNETVAAASSVDIASSSVVGAVKDPSLYLAVLNQTASIQVNGVEMIGDGALVFMRDIANGTVVFY